MQKSNKYKNKRAKELEKDNIDNDRIGSNTNIVAQRETLNRYMAFILRQIEEAVGEMFKIRAPRRKTQGRTIESRGIK